jgi:hypothetical protein
MAGAKRHNPAPVALASAGRLPRTGTESENDRNNCAGEGNAWGTAQDGAIVYLTTRRRRQRAHKRPFRSALGVLATFTKARIQARRRQSIKQPLYVIVHGIGQHERGNAETQRRHERQLTPRDLEVSFAGKLPLSQFVIERRQLAFRQVDGPFDRRPGGLNPCGLCDGFGCRHRTTERRRWTSTTAKRSVVHQLPLLRRSGHWCYRPINGRLTTHIELSCVSPS